MPIIIYPYEFNSLTLEIFPDEIVSDTFVVYHGTAEYHSNNIETNGFQLDICPFDINAARELCNLLDNPFVVPFDLPNRFGQTCQSSFSGYIFGIENNQLRLSFSNLSYGCVPFASGPLKGGQSLNHVNEAKRIVNNAIAVNPGLSVLITPTISNLFAQVEQIQNSRGIVYAIRFPRTLDGLEMGTGVVHCTFPIPSANIIGKIIIPENGVQDNVSIQDISSAHQKKLFTPPNGLGILIEKKNQEELDDEEGIEHFLS